jgi:hypothetical protein
MLPREAVWDNQMLVATFARRSDRRPPADQAGPGRAIGDLKSLQWSWPKGW